MTGHEHQKWWHAVPPRESDPFEGRPVFRHDLHQVEDLKVEALPTPSGEQTTRPRRSPLLKVLVLLLLPLWFPVFMLAYPVMRLMPLVRWVERYLDDPGPHNLWGPPKVEEIKRLLGLHGCYCLHGELGSGKTMGGLMLGLVMAWSHVEQLAAKGDDRTLVYLFVNFTVNDYRSRLFLVLLGAPPSVVERIRVEQFSVMDQTDATKRHVWRRRHSVIVADEIPYYMEDDKKTVRSMILRHFRMARRRQQTVLGIGQELIHSRYRPLFRLRGQCGMAFGRMRIVWRGAQDRVDSKKPTKPQATTAYGLDVRRLAKCYDTWEDLEDLDDDDQVEGVRPLRRAS